ncbi:hypothetical protein [Promicromonospora sp. NPDC050880]|uniref:hypothetical protein n=1 Tax=Promicromonospora sp. NPDC050880 TaxID=3364406 RepID=UPI0037B21391
MSVRIDEYVCPVEGCRFHVLASGPVDEDGLDPFADEIEQHKRGHELAAENTLRVRALCDAEHVMHKPTGRIGRVLGIYGEDATATKAWVAYGDEMNIAAHFDVPGREDSLIADLEPVDPATSVRGVSSQAGLQAVMHGPTIPSDGVPATEPAPSGVPTPAELRAGALLVAVGEAALTWQDADPDQPAGIAAEGALSDAITAYRTEVGR